jgi:GT2 family glycosyltransferase
MLIKREVINKIGLFDEDYEIGFWEDTDYCQRAKKAGYICAAAKAAYVFHHSHRTFEIFERNKVNGLFEKNKELFYSKWGKLLRIACIVFEKDINLERTDKILKLARDGHMIYLFLRRSASLNVNIEHGNIREYRYPDIFFNFLALIKILQRQKTKKKFDKVLIDNPEFARRLQSSISNLEIEIIQS